MNHHELAEKISLMMTFAGATITEYQQNVLASCLKFLEVKVEENEKK